MSSFFWLGREYDFGVTRESIKGMVDIIVKWLDCGANSSLRYGEI